MAITREAIENRIAALESDHARVLAHLNAIEGAIEDCRFWLQQAEEDAGGDEEPPPAVE